MLSRLAILLILLCTTAFAQTARPDGLIRTSRGWIRPQRVATWSDLVDIDREAGKLRVAFAPKNACQNMYAGGRSVAVWIAEPSSAWATGGSDWIRGDAGRKPWRSFEANRIVDPAAPHPYTLTRMSVTPGGSDFTGAGLLDGRATEAALTVQASGDVRLVVQTKGAAAIQCAAPSFDAFLSRNPSEARLYARPLFQALGRADVFAAPAADVYRTFTEIDPDAETIAAFEAVVPLLGDADPARREAGQHQLAALGRRGVLAALRRGRGDLNEQQMLTIDAFLAANAGEARADSPRGDPLFLIDCVTDENARVRAIAKVTLERMYGRKIDLDPAAPATTLPAEARKILQSMSASPAAVD